MAICEHTWTKSFGPEPTLSKNHGFHLKYLKIPYLAKYPKYGKSTYSSTGFYGLLRANYGLCTGRFFGYVLGTYRVRTSTYPVRTSQGCHISRKKSTFSPQKLPLLKGTWHKMTNLSSKRFGPYLAHPEKDMCRSHVAVQILQVQFHLRRPQF